MEAIANQLRNRQDLSAAKSGELVEAMISGDLSAELAKEILLAWRDKGETADEVAGAAMAMRAQMTRIRTPQSQVVDTCGTGGAGSGIFNVSTTAALIAAAAGIPVAKHGNRKISSQSGSADVLSELGVNIDADTETVERCLNELGICFCFAQKLHPAMKNIAPVRQALGVPTVFNLLGPLCNPADASFQVLGVGRPEIHQLIAEALKTLGTKRAVILHSEDGLCEISNSAPTKIILIENQELSESQWSPDDFGLSFSDRAPIEIDSPPESAELIRGIAAGKTGPARDIAVMNAAAAIWVVGAETSLHSAARRAEKAIDSGDVRNLLKELAQLSNKNN